MEPLFDRHGKTVAWLHDDRIVGLAGEHVAFLASESVVDYGGRHLGVFHNGFMRDHGGCAVAYIRGATGGPHVRLPALPPLPPLFPLPPIKPLEPLAPVAGNPSLLWSSLSWDEFLSH